MLAAMMLFACITAPNSASASTTLKAPDSTGLVGYWSFDSNTISGTTVKDLSGNGNNGTLVNSPTPVPGILNQALSFNGSTSYVNGGASGTLGATIWTISTWVNGRSFSTNPFVLGRSSITDYHSGVNYYLQVLSNGKIEAGFYDTGWRFVDTTATIGTSAWHHLTASYDGTYVRIYIDGTISITSASLVGHTPPTSSQSFYIGLEPYPGNQYFNGTIDEVRIYNRALTAAQVATLYNDSKATHVAHSNTTTLSTGLVGYWTFDGNSLNWKTGTAADASGNNNTGQLVGMSTTTSPTIGKIGGALKFNGVSSSVLAPVASTATDNVTISGWVYTASSSQKSRALFYNGNTGSNGYGLYLGACGTSPGVVTALLGGVNCDVLSSTYTLPTRQWMYLALVRQSTTWRLYVNGVLGVTGGTNSPNSPAGKFAIGSNQSSGENFEGKIDDVRIYNRALSANEVKQLYASGAANINHSNTVALSNGLVGYWTFDGNSLNWKTGTASDVSGNGNTGTMVGMSTTTSPTIGKIGQALRFNGSSSVVTVATGTNIPIGSSNYTISAWIKPVSLGGFGGIVGWGNYGSSNQVNAFRLADSTTCSGGKGLINYWWANDLTACTNLITANVWHFVLAEFDGTTRRIYVDGTLVNSDTPTGHNVPNTNSFKIGQTCPVNICGANSGEYFPGTIDDVRIYNRALSAAEVQQLYLTGK